MKKIKYEFEDFVEQPDFEKIQNNLKVLEEVAREETQNPNIEIKLTVEHFPGIKNISISDISTRPRLEYQFEVSGDKSEDDYILKELINNFVVVANNFI